VEIFYRYFLASNQLQKAFLMKASVPITLVIFFFLLSEVDLIYRFIYAFGLSCVISTIIIFCAFKIENKKLKR